MALQYDLACSLQGLREISDFAISGKPSCNDNKELTVFVVPATSLPLSILKQKLVQQTAAFSESIEFVPVSGIPLDENGLPDLAALNRFPILNRSLISGLEKMLSEAADITACAALIIESEEQLATVYVNDSAAGMSAPDGNMYADRTARGQPHQQNGNLQAAGTGAPVLAESDGGRLLIPEDSPKTLIAALQRSAAESADNGLVLAQSPTEHKTLSYADLLERARRVLSGLRKAGVREQDPVVLQLDTLEQHYITFWACVLGGIIPVTVASPPLYDRKTSVSEKLFSVWTFLQQPKIITSGAKLENLSNLAWLHTDDQIDIQLFEELQACARAERLYDAKPDDVVFYQLTSGSTGLPKFIQETHKGIISHIHGSSQYIGYHRDDITFNWLAVDHVVPILTFHLKDVYLGSTQIHVPTGHVLSSPLRWLDYLEAYRVTHTWAPNFAFKLVSDALERCADKKWDLSAMKYFMNAGEQVTAEVVQNFLGWMGYFGLPNSVMQPAFGMAETCTCMTYENQFELKNNITLYQSHDHAGQGREISFVELGRPMPGVKVRIVDADNRLVPEGVIGRMQIAGDVVTPGYYKNDAANKQAFVGGGWFNSGDLGFIKNKSLVITGREKEVINIRGAGIFCHEVEEVVEAVDGVEPTFSAAIATKDPTIGSEALAIFYVAKDNVEHAELQQAIIREVAMNIGTTPLYVIPIAKQAFPKTTSGKKQRLSLQASLARGEYEQFTRKASVAKGITVELPKYVYRPYWQRKALLDNNGGGPEGICLVFVKDRTAGKLLAGHLERYGLAVVVASHGDDYRAGDSEFVIDLLQPEHYAQLFRQLHDDNINVSAIYHLCACDNSRNGEDARELTATIETEVLSLMHLSKAVAETGRDDISLIVASRHAQPVLQEERTLPARSMLGSLAHAVSQENSNLTCRHIDVDNIAPVDLAEILFKETKAVDETEIAYRNKQRMVKRIRRIDIDIESDAPFRLAKDKFLVLTGGLGGVGIHLTRSLLKNHSAKLLILGRKPLVAGEALASGFNMLSSLPGEVIYKVADVGDAQAVSHAVESAATEFGAGLGGIIHMAGIYHERPLAKETTASFLKVLWPKVQGTLVLSEIAARYPGSCFIGFSSVISYFGGAMVGAYAAANRFLDGVCHALNAKGEIRAYSLCWSSWDNTGLSKDYHGRDILAARGYLGLSTRQAVKSFYFMLNHPCGQYLLGLDDSKRFIQQHLNSSRPISTLKCFLEGRPHEPDKISGLVAEYLRQHDMKADCKLEWVESLPRRQDGGIDYPNLTTSGAAADAAKPSGDLESLVASVWRDVLQLESIGTTDNFFEIGGDSILLAKLEPVLKERLKVQFDTIDLFKYPTIKSFCFYIGDNAPADADKKDQLAGSQRGAMRKKFAKRRKQERSVVSTADD